MKLPYKRTDLSPSRRELTITVPAPVMDQELDQAIAHLAKNAAGGQGASPNRSARRTTFSRNRKGLGLAVSVHVREVALRHVLAIERLTPLSDPFAAWEPGPIDLGKPWRFRVRFDVLPVVSPIAFEALVRDPLAGPGERTEQLLDALAARYPVAIPKVAIDRMADTRRCELGDPGAATDPVDGERRARWLALIASVATQEGIEVTDTDIREELTRLAPVLGKTESELRLAYRFPALRNVLMGLLLEDRVVALLEERAA